MTEASEMSETYLQTLRRVKFKIPCFMFEQQIPHFIWDSQMYGYIAYKLHDLLCPEMWMIKIFPRWLDGKEVSDKDLERLLEAE